jgi:hypothetical protein
MGKRCLNSFKLLHIALSEAGFTVDLVKKQDKKTVITVSRNKKLPVIRNQYFKKRSVR